MKFTALLLCFFACAAFAEPAEGVKEIDIKGHTLSIQNDVSPKKLLGAVSPVYTIEGAAPADIIKRGQLCVTKHVSFAPVSATGGTASVFGFGNKGTTSSTQVGAGSLIELVDADNGILVANSRADYTGGLIIGYVVQSRLQIEAREGRFRITTSDLQQLQKDSGYHNNSGFSPVIAVTGTGWKKATEVAVSVAEKVATCMTVAPEADAW